jgi:hypothetical protein
MLLPQPLELCLQLGFFFFGHSQSPNSNVTPPTLPPPTLPLPAARVVVEEGREEASWPLRAPRKFCPAKYHD